MRILTLCLTLFCLVVAYGLHYLAFTEAGAKSLIDKVADAEVIQVSGVTGTLASHLCFEQLDFSNESISIKAERLCLTPAFASSLYHRYPRLAKLQASSVTVISLSRDKTPAFDAIHLPEVSLRMGVDNISITNLNLMQQQIHDLNIGAVRVLGNSIDINELSLESQQSDFNLEFELTGLQTMSPRINLTGNIEKEQQRFRVAAVGPLNKLLANASFEENKLSATINLQQTGWPFTATLATASYKIPLDDAVRSIQAHLQLVGDTKKADINGSIDYLVSMNPTIPNSPSTRSVSPRKQSALIKASTDWQQLDSTLSLDQFQLDISGLTAELSGDLIFNNSLIDLSNKPIKIIANLKPSQWPLVTKKLAAKAEFSVDLSTAEPNIKLEHLQASGPTTSLAATGHWKGSSDWQLDLTTSSLAIAWQDFSALASGEVNLKPDTSKAKLSLKALHYLSAEDRSATAEHATINLDTQDKNWLNLSLVQLKVANQPLANLSLAATGGLSEGQFDFSLNSELLITSLQGSYQYDAPRLALTLKEFATSVNRQPLEGAPVFQLAEPTKIIFSPAGVDFSSIRLINRFGGELALKYDSSNYSADLALQDFQLPAYQTLNGISIAAKLVGKFSSDDIRTGNVSGTATLLNFELKGIPDDIPDIDISQGQITASIQRLNEISNITIKAEVPELLTADAKLRQAENQLEASMTLALTNAGIFAPYVAPFATAPEGAIGATISVHTDKNSQFASGHVDWQNGSIGIEALGLYLSQIEARLQSVTDDKFSISFEAKDPLKNRVELSGELTEPLSPNRMLRLKLNTEAAQLLDRSDARALVTSNLTYQLTEEHQKLTGDLAISKALFQITSIPKSSVQVSRDANVIGRKVEQSAVPIELDLKLLVGPATHISAFGIDTGVEGTLHYRAKEGEASTAIGTLNTIKGSFSIYGQTLQIQSGKLSFNGPLDDPLIDITATRPVRYDDKDYRISVFVSGFANQLETRVISEPGLSEADALAMLIAGRPLSSAGNNDQKRILSAAIGMGLKGAGFLTDKIAGLSRLDELSISQSETGLELGAGVKLNEQLFLRYTYGALSHFGGVLIDYSLSNNLRLRATAGDSQSVELQYIFGNNAKPTSDEVKAKTN